MAVNEYLWRDARGYETDDVEAIRDGRNMILWGGQCQHSLEEMCVVEKLLDLSGPGAIVEIGTGQARLAVYFGVWAMLHPRAEVLTLDVVDRIGEQMRATLGQLGVALWLEDCFAPKARDKIAEFVSSRRTLIYCDGGDKPRELRTFVESLQPADVIACHDFGIEVAPEDFADAWCQRHGLRRLWPELLTNYGCRQAAWAKE